ncbi:MAG: hypothetical protein LBD52_06030 [Prevotellaceae bacterium]|nr:hypothetical protein [Prevotellaceae bacterium]
MATTATADWQSQNHETLLAMGLPGRHSGGNASTPPPTNWEELTHSSFDTHTPFRLSFGNDQRGQTVRFALRW